MNWEANAEAAIVNRLGVALSPLPVEPLPDGPYSFTHPDGTALVAWLGADPAGSVDVYTMAQPVELAYEVVLISASLRDGNGLYPMWWAVRQALLGWPPLPELTPLRLLRVRPRGYEDGAWRLGCTWATDALYVAGASPDIGPLLKKLTIERID